ncbi:hypothetical protein DdX_00998 [Ditylenchus destructor]|uniref:Uncharacterized protein n=1 Tax=Ditylenchus destructor TaxID=166010 RepID=A0AAD4RDN5_9BILA|nr:hypothetical protein DdX_00998 [Ditylenchus destructor]
MLSLLMMLLAAVFLGYFLYIKFISTPFVEHSGPHQLEGSNVNEVTNSSHPSKSSADNQVAEVSPSNATAKLAQSNVATAQLAVSNTNHVPPSVSEALETVPKVLPSLTATAKENIGPSDEEARKVIESLSDSTAVPETKKALHDKSQVSSNNSDTPEPSESNTLQSKIPAEMTNSKDEGSKKTTKQERKKKKHRSKSKTSSSTRTFTFCCG